MNLSTHSASETSPYVKPQLPSENPLLQMIRGLPISHLFKKEIIEEILDFHPQDGDVIIATFPKTGTTWMQYIVLQLLTQGKQFPSFNDMLENAVPFLEMTGVSAVEKMTNRPRVYKHHMPYNVMHKNPNAKIIYVYRKPEDTLVSLYHFINAVTATEKVDFDQFFENFLAGSVSYGRYFEHVLSYLVHKDDENLLLMPYERLQSNRKEEILRIASFLGEEYYHALLDDESFLNDVMGRTSFGYMKNNLTLFVPAEPLKKESFAPKKEVIFFRKGIVGDGKNSLSKEQLNRLEKLTKHVMKGTSILNEWLSD